jgi:hypothetical protein
MRTFTRYLSEPASRLPLDFELTNPERLMILRQHFDIAKVTVETVRCGDGSMCKRIGCELWTGQRIAF